jgi:hypothetical protein
MHALKFLTSGKSRFNRASEASHLARNAADIFAPSGIFPVIKSSLISARINAGGLMAQTGVSQAYGKKNCYGRKSARTSRGKVLERWSLDSFVRWSQFSALQTPLPRITVEKPDK